MGKSWSTAGVAVGFPHRQTQYFFPHMYVCWFITPIEPCIYIYVIIYIYLPQTTVTGVTNQPNLANYMGLHLVWALLHGCLPL